MIRGAHDYQRICLDFGGGVAHVSDQGLFIVPRNSSKLELIKVCRCIASFISLLLVVSSVGRFSFAVEVVMEERTMLPPASSATELRNRSALVLTSALSLVGISGSGAGQRKYVEQHCAQGCYLQR